MRLCMLDRLDAIGKEVNVLQIEASMPRLAVALQCIIWKSLLSAYFEKLRFKEVEFERKGGEFIAISQFPKHDSKFCLPGRFYGKSPCWDRLIERCEAIPSWDCRFGPHQRKRLKAVFESLQNFRGDRLRSYIRHSFWDCRFFDRQSRQIKRI